MNKIKQTLMVLLTLTFSGCIYQTINADEIALAHWYCQDKGGVLEIKENASSLTEIKCKAPFSRYVSEYSIKKDYLEYLKDKGE